MKAHRARASKRTSPEGARREPQVASMSNHAPRKASEAGKDRQARNEHIWRAVQAQSAKTIEAKARPSHKSYALFRNTIMEAYRHHRECPFWGAQAFPAYFEALKKNPQLKIMYFAPGIMPEDGLEPEL